MTAATDALIADGRELSKIVAENTAAMNKLADSTDETADPHPRQCRAAHGQDSGAARGGEGALMFGRLMNFIQARESATRLLDDTTIRVQIAAANNIAAATELDRAIDRRAGANQLLQATLQQTLYRVHERPS